MPTDAAAHLWHMCSSPMLVVWKQIAQEDMREKCCCGCREPQTVVISESEFPSVRDKYHRHYIFF